LTLTVAAKPVGLWFEDMPLTRHHWFAGATLFVAFVIEAWEMMILILNSGAVAKDLNLGTEQLGFLISAMFLGMIPGSILWGRLSDIFGRKKSLIASIGLYAIFPILSANAQSFEILWVVRFLCGVVISGSLVVTFPYLTELLPSRRRGQGTVFLSAGWPLGMLGAIAATALLADAGWRTALGINCIFGLWVFAIWKYVPESPYWLAEKGHTSGADTIIAQISGGTVQAKSVPSPEATAKTSFFSIFGRGLLSLTALQTLVNFCFAWGYWGLTSWLPALLAERGLSGGEGLVFLATSALFMFPGYIAASFLTGRFGRKKVMASFVLGATIAGFGFAYSTNESQLYLWNICLSFFSLGAWGVWNTWLGELYATNVRGQGVAWGVMMQRVANSVAPIAIGSVIAVGGFLTTVIFISAFLLMTFAICLFLQETEGVALS